MMNTVTQSANREKSSAILFPDLVSPILTSSQTAIPQLFFQRLAEAAALQILPEHADLLEWLYCLVESTTAEFDPPLTQDARQRLVADIIKRVIRQLPQKQGAVLEHVELGGDTIETAALLMDLPTQVAGEILGTARASFSDQVQRTLNSVALA